MKTTTKKTTYVLTSCCGAHIIQDGLGALQYVLLPILAQTFGLSYAQVGSLRAISKTARVLLEVPAGILSEKVGERQLLALGLIGAGLGYLGVALAPDFRSIALLFLLAGAGAALQHSLASSVVVKTSDFAARRRALGAYNSSGDAGKLAFTGIFSLGIGAGLAWNGIVIILAALALVFGVAVWFLLKGVDTEHVKIKNTPTSAGTASRWGIKDPRNFSFLGIVVFLDSMVQSVFLTFLAFILLEKGATSAVATGAVVLALAGGMVGKFCCGFLAARFGDRNAFILIQILTVTGIASLIILPAQALLVLLPGIGLVVQGSSTVTYGSVADFVDQGRQSRGYALIYTLVSGSSMVGPFLFGLMADQATLSTSISLLALIVCLTIPLAFVLSKKSNIEQHSAPCK